MKKILVLNLMPNTLGDTVMMTPLIKVLQENFPQCQLYVTGDSLSAQIFEHCKLNGIITIPELNLIGKKSVPKWKKMLLYGQILRTLIPKLRSEHFDECYVTYPKFAPVHLIPYLSRIPIRVGWVFSKGWFSFLLTHKIESKDMHSGYFRRHIVEAYIDLARARGLKINQKQLQCEIEIEPQKVISLKKKYDLNEYICIHAMSKDSIRNWPQDRFIKLINKIIHNHQLKVVLVGSPAEKEYNDQIANSHPQFIINMCGAINLHDIGYLLKGAKLFIGNDSGMSHYACALGTTTIALFGPANPENSRPLGIGKSIVISRNNDLDIIKKYYYINREKYGRGKMELISVNDVFKEVNKIL